MSSNLNVTISVVIPTRDRPVPLARLLARLGNPGRFIDVIVVDDGSELPVTSTAPGVTIIRNERPRYLSAARNAGANRAKGDILVFADDDCVLDGDAVRRLGTVLLKDRGVGVAGPVIAYLEKPSTIWSAGNVRKRWTDRAHFRAQGLPLESAHRLRPDCMEFPTVFAIRRELFERIGGFDVERYPMHMSEGDLCQRVRQLGYRISLVPGAVVWHDLPLRSPWTRRLHAVGWRAYFVGRDRVSFLRHSPSSLDKRVVHFAFWFGVLVPVYLAAFMLDPGTPLRERLEEMRLFLLGNWHGLRNARIPAAVENWDSR